MSPLPAPLAALGPVMQMAYVPTDFDAALNYWTRTLGVGPFFVWEKIEVDELTYYGERTQLDFSVALSYWGDMQIELIRQNDATPSIYRDWNSNRLHHIQLAVDDYDGALKTCERSGFKLAMQGHGLLGSPELKFAYCELGEYGPAGFVEFARRPPTPTGEMDRMEQMKSAVANWDGTDPLRPLF